MAHDFNVIELITLSITVIVSIGVAYLLNKRRLNQGIRALNVIILLFVSLSILGLLELISDFFHEDLIIFQSADEITTLFLDTIRLVNLVIILIMYWFGENIITKRPHILRISIVITLLSGMFFIGTIGFTIKRAILTNEVIGFANETRLEELLFDFLQLFVVSFLLIIFIMQLNFTQSPQFTNYLRLLILTLILFLISITFEVLEHLIFGLFDISAFITILPTIILLAYLYVRYPNMILMVPAHIKFLQLITKEGGVPVYYAEFRDNDNVLNFLAGSGISSIRLMFSEILSSQDKNFEMKSFEYSNGYIVFIEGKRLIALLQTSRLSKILNSALSYFMNEFEKVYSEQLKPFFGTLEPVNGMTPDDILTQCIPIVDAKAVISSFDNE